MVSKLWWIIGKDCPWMRGAHAWLKSCSIYRTCNNTYINNWNKKSFYEVGRWVWVSPFKSPKCAIKNTLLERAALILQFTRNNKTFQKRRKNNYSQRDYTQGSTFKTKSSIPIQKIVVKYIYDSYYVVKLMLPQIGGIMI